MEISNLLSNFLVSELNAGSGSSGGVAAIDPAILVENAYLLTQGRLYEDCMEKLLNRCRTPREIKAAERVDAYLRGFVSAERKARCRLKLNYIMAGAASNRLDQAIKLLSESDEIDEDLLMHIGGLIKKEMMKKLGPAYDVENKSEEDKLDGVGKFAVDVLRMIERRLEVELRMVSQPAVQLLSRLMNEKSTQVREEMLSKELLTVEALEEFDAFVADGIAFILTKSDTRSSSGSSAEGGSDRGVVQGTGLERMRDVKGLVDKVLRRLRTGLGDDTDIFSTDAEDYLPKQ